MRKMSLIAAVAALSTTAAMAGTTNLYFVDARCGTPANTNPTIYVSTAAQSAAVATNSGFANPNWDQGALDLKLKVDNRGGGTAPDHQIISALGLNINASGSNISGAFTLYNTAAQTGAGVAPWSGTLNGTGGAAPALVTNIRGVAVPNATNSPLWGGYAPSATAYTAGQLAVTGGTLATGEVSHSVNMAVNSLKITRVYDPTASNPNAGSAEQVSFGYDAGAFETAVSGSTVGATSTVADATVIQRKLGDVAGFNNNGDLDPNTPDGVVDDNDLLFVQGVSNGGIDLSSFTPPFPRSNFDRIADVAGFDNNGDLNPGTRDCVVDDNDLLFIQSFVEGT